MMISNSIFGLLFLTWAATVSASDRECSDEGYDDICNCNLYKSTNCEKPKYYYNNGEGGSYNIKNWDEDCAACCCITVKETVRTPNPTASPTFITVIERESNPPTSSPTVNATQWGSNWSNNDSWSGGGGGGGSGGGSTSKPKPKPMPKPKPVEKPKPKPKKIIEMLKPKPKPKPQVSTSSNGSSSSGGSSWSSGSDWSGNGNGGGWGSGSPTLTPVASPISVKEPSREVTLNPIPTLSTPESSPPFARPTPVAAPVAKPTKPSYYYNAEGSSYKQKSASGAIGSMSQISSMVWAGVAIVAVGMIGFVAGLQMSRRRINQSSEDLMAGSDYEQS